MEIEDRAATEAEGVLTYFHNLELLGVFAEEPVTDQKRAFLIMAFINFARQEKSLHPDIVTVNTSGMVCALRQVISSLETLGADGWSEAPYLLRECRKALT